ncbi:MAG: hypothetical protein WC505_00040 [Patescibacteria group bacterium]
MSRMKKKPAVQRRRFPRALIFIILIAAALSAIIIIASVNSRQNSQPAAEMGTNPEECMRGQETLKRLVQSHPDPRIRIGMDSLVANGVIYLNFQSLFTLGDEGIATFCIINIASVGYAPTFNIHLSQLLDPAVPDQFKQLVILHEYAHFLQYQKGIVPEERFYYGSAPEQLTERELCELFEVECQAYLAESKCACEQGWSYQFDICEAYRTGSLMGMRQRLAERYSMLPEFKPFRSLLFRLAADTTNMLPAL